ncbi:MAG TPA: hypothetical protein VIL32_13995, partial [Steroidobacteraceae bacterium]
EWVEDCIALEDERVDGEPLLEEVMRAGKRIRELPALSAIRERCRTQLQRLPAQLKSLKPGHGDLPVRISEGVQELARKADALNPLS